MMPILPLISKLTTGQTMYHFISGYTAKAGTEAGVTEPKATFSNCFGAPFLPLHPTFYAAMLGKRIDQYKPKIWFGKYRMDRRTLWSWEVE